MSESKPVSESKVSYYFSKDSFFFVKKKKKKGLQ